MLPGLRPAREDGRDDCIAAPAAVSVCFDRRALDMSQREIGVPRDAGNVVETPATSPHAPRSATGQGASRPCRANQESGDEDRNREALLLAACLLNVGANALAETSTEPVVRNGVAYITGGIGRTRSPRFAMSRLDTTCGSPSHRMPASTLPTSM